MVVDKKFERIMGINLEIREENKPNQAQEYFMNELLPKTDFYIKQYGGKYKRLCNIITNPDNYISDCNIAIFMLMGERYASVKGLLDVPRNWPFSVKDTKTTAWCGAFQSVILLGDNQDLCFTDLCDKGRLGRFEYHRMADIYQRLEEQIENEYESEEKMQTGDQIDINECLKRVYRDSTAGRKENWVLADIFLGRSLSIILYHWISQISKRKEVKLSWFKEMIDLFSAMKCFQLRNVLMDIIFRITFAEILKMDGGKNGDESLKELIQRLRIEWEPLLITVNQYYQSILTSKWYEARTDERMSDESYRHRIQGEVASGIGEYIESIDSDSDIVERFCQTVEVYKIELEEDLKLFYDAKHDYVADDEVIIIGDILLFILKSKDSLSEKEVEIQREEYQKLKEREMKTKITGDRKKVTANASVLYTFIHWEVMKTLQVHINS